METGELLAALDEEGVHVDVFEPRKVGDSCVNPGCSPVNGGLEMD